MANRTALSLFLIIALFARNLQAQARHPRENLRGVLSRGTLAPPLHGDAAIRFSPDGKFLFVQDLSGVMLFSRNPLQLISYIRASFAYPARFSSDSQTLVLFSPDLSFSKWRVSDGVRLELGDLSIPTGCLSASLSPNADFISCLMPDMGFAIYRLDSRQKVFSTSMGSQSFAHSPVPVRLDTRSAFPAPFGYVLANDWKPMANRRLISMPAWFSPDSKFVIVGGKAESFRVNLTTFKKENLPSSVRNHFSEVAGVLSEERAVLMDESKQTASIVSLSNGNTISTAGVSADSILLSSDSRFVLLKNMADSGVRILNLQTNQLLAGIECVSADFHDDIIAALTPEHIVKFFHVDQKDPFLGARLPLTGLPPLIAAGVSPNLDSLALAVDGAGTLFQLSDGHSLVSEKRFAGAVLSGPGHFMFLSFARNKSWMEVSRFDSQSHAFVSAWVPREGGELHSGEHALLEYSFSNPMGRGFVMDLSASDIPYRLRGLDPDSGAKLWEQEFGHGAPIPFADPQGERFVLGWKAKSDGASGGLRKWRERCEECKKTKIGDLDTFFDVRDSLTGKSLGGVLVQLGSGPISFTAAHSAGQALFVIKDDVRVSVFSLESGKLIGHVKGLHPTASAQSNLFVLDESNGRLGVFDLLTCAKLEEQQFPDEIAYMHFSTDGKRLLVVTQHQEVFTLDMSTVREHPLLPENRDTAPSGAPADQPQ